MITIKGNILTEKGNVSSIIREDAKALIAGVAVILTNGKQIVLESKGSGDYFGPFAQGEDAVLNARVSVALTAEDYKAPAKAKAKKVEREPIEIIIEE